MYKFWSLCTDLGSSVNATIYLFDIYMNLGKLSMSSEPLLFIHKVESE